MLDKDIIMYNKDKNKQLSNIPCFMWETAPYFQESNFNDKIEICMCVG